MASVLKVLAANGAQEAVTQMPPPVLREVGAPQKKQSRNLIYHQLKSLKGIPFSRPHLARLEETGEFPRRVQISAARIGWREDEVDEWLQSKADARSLKKKRSKRT